MLQPPRIPVAPQGLISMTRAADLHPDLDGLLLTDNKALALHKAQSPRNLSMAFTDDAGNGRRVSGGRAVFQIVRTAERLQDQAFVIG